MHNQFGVPPKKKMAKMKWQKRHGVLRFSVTINCLFSEQLLHLCSRSVPKPLRVNQGPHTKLWQKVRSPSARAVSTLQTKRMVIADRCRRQLLLTLVAREFQCCLDVRYIFYRETVEKLTFVFFKYLFLKVLEAGVHSLGCSCPSFPAVQKGNWVNRALVCWEVNPTK